VSAGLMTSAKPRARQEVTSRRVTTSVVRQPVRARPATSTRS
jgi:hypothetical protein